MFSFAKKLQTSLLITIPSLLLLGVAWNSLSQNSWVMIESTESQTSEFKEVYNKIKYTSSMNQDSLKMKQSHSGVHSKLWDDLEIRIDKSKTPYQVSYHQYKDGKESEYRASCYLCHANGPRLIRPNYQSQSAPLSAKEKLIIHAMNLRIKSYPRMETVKNDSLKRIVPLKYEGKLETTSLTVKTCTFCHNSNTFWGRGELKRQQMNTISHLVSTKQMPPWPFKLDKKEQEQLDLYIRGF